MGNLLPSLVFCSPYSKHNWDNFVKGFWSCTSACAKPFPKIYCLHGKIAFSNTTYNVTMHYLFYYAWQKKEEKKTVKLNVSYGRIWYLMISFPHSKYVIWWFSCYKDISRKTFFSMVSRLCLDRHNHNPDCNQSVKNWNFKGVPNLLWEAWRDWS